MMPDITTTLDFALHRMIGVVEKLIVYPDQMQKNMDALGGLHNSQRVLLALTQKGMSREDAYAIVQRHALPIWEEGGSLLENLKADEQVMTHLSAEELAACFDDTAHTKHIDTIFNRVFGTNVTTIERKKA